MAHAKTVLRSLGVRMSRLRPVVFLVLALTLMFQASGSSSTDRARDLREAFLRYCSVPLERARIAHETTFDFPLTHRQVHAAKILDSVSGSIEFISVDELLRPVTLSDIQRAEFKAYNKVNGKRHHLLTERLKKASPEQRIPVAIWLTEPDTSPAERRTASRGYALIAGKPEGPGTMEALDLLTSEKSKIYRAHNTPMADSVRGFGGNVDYVSELAPVVFATLTPPQIALAEKFSRTERIYLSPGFKRAMASANASVKNVAMKAAGHTGKAEIKVAIVDAESQVDFANPYLNHLGGITRPGRAVVEDHSTMAAGIIASKKEAADSAYPPGAADGIAPNVRILSADFREPLDQAIIDGPAGNSRADTAVAAGSDDQQVIPVGGAAGVRSVIIAPGPDGVLNTVPAADDVRTGTVFEPWAGGNGKADTFKMGDDVQVIPFGQNAPPGAVIISAGPNHELDTIQWGADDLGVLASVWDLTNLRFAPAYDFAAAVDWAIGQGAAVVNNSTGGGADFGVVDRYVDYIVRQHFRAIVNAAGNECEAIYEPYEGGNGIADTVAAGDDVQLFILGLHTTGGESVQSATEIVQPGPDGILDTVPSPRIYEATAFPPPPGGRKADTMAQGDDVQVIPVGNPTTGGDTIVGPGPNGELDTAPAGDDIAADDVMRNDGLFCFVISPALAYNVISVGAIDDLNTAAPDDDQRSFFSSWRETPERGKPELSAPGSRIITTVVTGGELDNRASGHGGMGGQVNGDGISNFGLDGTSFAAPIVTGLLATMIHMDPSLIAWPETTKAIAIASAQRNVYDNAIENLEAVNWDPREGAGTIVSDEAHDIITKKHYAKTVVGPTDFPRVRVVHGDKDEILRYVIVWPSDATSGAPYDLASDSLMADLDLEVRDAKGELVASSLNYNQGFEIVSFVVPESQNYEVTIVAAEFTGAYEFLGEAWSAEDVPPPQKNPPPWGRIHRELK